MKFKVYKKPIKNAIKRAKGANVQDLVIHFELLLTSIFIGISIISTDS